MLDESTFRRESARLTAGLVRAFGPDNLSLAEDVVQETFVRAMQEWSLRGIPAQPSAWLARVARNLAVDRLRREKRYAGSQALEFAPFDPQEPTLIDDELAMLLMCAHPTLSHESQLALTLKSVCGLGVGEIAKGLLSSESAIAQRLVRAKAALREVQFELPSDLDDRLAVVLKVLYLLFNEGYLAASGNALINSDVCDEAILLTHRLSMTPTTERPEVHALLALMLLHSSRLPARVGDDGSLRLLEDQDRSLWDHTRIAAGMAQLALAATGHRLTPYHCEAAIAACHAGASSFEQTDWKRVLANYDDLVEINSNGIARLNRAVAVSMVEGEATALALLDALDSDPKMRSYYLLPATKARLQERAKNFDRALEQYRRALSLTVNEAERTYLQSRITALS